MSRAQHPPISVLIAHFNAMSAELIANGFKRHPHFQVVARAVTGAEVTRAVEKDHVDVALISSSLQDGPFSGLGVLKKLRELRPSLKTVLLVDNFEPHVVVDAFRAGAKGVFCPRQSEFKTLCKCAERVHSGQIWASSSELGHVMEAFAQYAPLRVVNDDGMRLLTKREEDVVACLAEGLGNRDIARQLNLSEHTVKNYLFNIFDKLGVSSRVELVLYAVSSSKRAQVAGTANSDHAIAGNRALAGVE